VADFYTGEDSSVTAALRELDIVENGGTSKEALDNLIEYAEEYQENLSMYFAPPNGHGHYPYVLEILSENSKEEVSDLICSHAG